MESDLSTYQQTIINYIYALFAHHGVNTGKSDLYITLSPFSKILPISQSIPPAALQVQSVHNHLSP